MGTSKYEFNPEQLDVDVQNNILRHKHQKELIHNLVMSEIKKDGSRMDQTFSIFLEVLREIKEEYTL